MRAEVLSDGADVSSFNGQPQAYSSSLCHLRLRLTVCGSLFVRRAGDVNPITFGTPLAFVVEDDRWNCEMPSRVSGSIVGMSEPVKKRAKCAQRKAARTIGRS